MYTTVVNTTINDSFSFMFISIECVYVFVCVDVLFVTGIYMFSAEGDREVLCAILHLNAREMHS